MNCGRFIVGLVSLEDCFRLLRTKNKHIAIESINKRPAIALTTATTIIQFVLDDSNDVSVVVEIDRQKYPL